MSRQAHPRAAWSPHGSFLTSSQLPPRQDAQGAEGLFSTTAISLHRIAAQRFHTINVVREVVRVTAVNEAARLSAAKSVISSLARQAKQSPNYVDAAWLLVHAEAFVRCVGLGPMVLSEVPLLTQPHAVVILADELALTCQGLPTAALAESNYAAVRRRRQP
jgi:hypothetical protein